MEPLEDRRLLSGDVVIEWNQILLNEIRNNRTAPPPASRIMAIVQVAVFDAVNAIDGSYAPYLLQSVPKRDKGGSLVAAAAQAAHDTLVALYPSDRVALDAQLRADLLTIRNQGALKKGVEVGQLAAAALLQARADDGANATVPYTPGSGPGVWVPTPPSFLPSAFPQWPHVTPFTMTSGSQFRPDGPPPLDSDAYASAYTEVKDFGGDGVTTPTIRTDEQTTIALFWADGPGTETPPGHWNTIAQAVAQAQETSLVENARMFALLDLALADAAIDAWDCKYANNFWRPITAIRAGDTDGNASTIEDTTWTPLLVTPNFSSYVSGHSTFSSAAATVLANFFGTDNVSFTTGSDFLPGVTRSFASFSAAAAEAGQSRIYGGIHFQFDNTDALASGGALGTYVFDNFLAPQAQLTAAAAAHMPVHETLRANQGQPLLAEALHRWQIAGANNSVVNGIDIRIADVGGRTLGLASGHTITLDDNAAGWGWFVDPTPADKSKFMTPGNQGQMNRMDLLTVLDHELGHLLSYEHTQYGLMSPALATGIRETPTAVIDQFFAEV